MTTALGMRASLIWDTPHVASRSAVLFQLQLCFKVAKRVLLWASGSWELGSSSIWNNDRVSSGLLSGTFVSLKLKN